MLEAIYSTCYHCNGAATGREHVPPKCLFPKGGNWFRLTTVPSCAAHNNAASEADEYLRFLLGALALSAPDAIKSGAARGAVRLAQKGAHNLDRYGFRWEDDTLEIGRDFSIDFELLSTSLVKMARALYFHDHGGRRKLAGTLHVLPLFIPIESASDWTFSFGVALARTVVADHFKNRPRLGGHQEIFAYQFIEAADSLQVNMQFYGAHNAAVICV
jgi:hypothetical protein